MHRSKKANRISDLLVSVLTGKTLSQAQSRDFFKALFAGSISPVQAKTFLLLMAKRGETAEELLGCLEALRSLERPIGPKVSGLADTCGTGGDGRQTMNISTLTALVLAGAGAKVAKHGNRAISSRSGSSDLMEALGVRLDAGPSPMIRAIRRCGMGYFHAPHYHPIFAKVQPLRRALKRRTLLNLLGPLVNPMRLDYQMVGVSCMRLVPLYAKVLSSLGRKSAFVFHCLDGMDEISTTAPTRGIWITPQGLRSEMIRPRAFGLQRCSLKDLAISSVRESYRRALNILKGLDQGPARDTILLNAAVALKVCQMVNNIPEGIQLARKSVDSGNAYEVVRKLKEFSRSNDPQ